MHRVESDIVQSNEVSLRTVDFLYRVIYFPTRIYLKCGIALLLTKHCRQNSRSTQVDCNEGTTQSVVKVCVLKEGRDADSLSQHVDGDAEHTGDTRGEN